MVIESPYAAPKSELQQRDAADIFAHKRYILHHHSATWPARCFKCNAETDQVKNVKLTYVNPWIYLTILITPIITIILALIFQKRFSVEVPICETHRRKRRNFLIMQWTLVLLMLLSIGASLVVKSGVGAVLAMVLLLVIVISAIAGRMLFAAKYKNGYFWIKGAGKPFLDTLPPYQG